ncbi:altered inheritance rate of mitochondria protein 25-like [Lolium rigidum]|uniref:altered inheritance rate of mitochondria protein 25-like n=1 Tax=Lolium rigidum TaxID=89674 RepID=UPI001F5CAD17|nr:altered inheritance rate of mitochondria protein 25-like [Lolium rigidum]
MSWLPRLLSHAAAARRIPARTTTSHASGGRGGAPGVGVVVETVVRSEEPKRRPDAAKRTRRPAVAAAVVPSEELKKHPDAAKSPAAADAVVRSEEEPKKRRRGADKKPRKRRAVSKSGRAPGVSLARLLANAARAFVNSKLAALGRSFLRSWQTAGKEDSAPPTSYQHGEELDLSLVQDKLQPLLSRANLIITKRAQWANIMFRFQQETRYIIKDPRTPRRKTVSPVGLIREKSNFILRQLLRSRRPFIAEFIDHKGKEIFTVRRPFWWISSSIYAEMDGKEIGVVHSRWHLWRRIYDLYLGNRQFAVVENPGFWSWTFTLVDENDNVVAKIQREARGIGWQVFTDAGQYTISFGSVGNSWSFIDPEDADKVHTFTALPLPERAVTLALAVSLDHDYFTRRLGWGLRSIFGE